jgi:hypothetical protein
MVGIAAPFVPGQILLETTPDNVKVTAADSGVTNRSRKIAETAKTPTRYETRILIPPPKIYNNDSPLCKELSLEPDLAG